MSNVYVPGKGNAYASIAIIGAHPGYDEERTLEPFSGPGGRELDRILHEIKSLEWIAGLLM